MHGMTRLAGPFAVTALVAASMAAPASAGDTAGSPVRRVAGLTLHARPSRSVPVGRFPTSLEVQNDGRRTTDPPPASATATATEDPSAPVAAFGFDAIGDVDGYVPSDTTGALGDDHFLTAVNSSYALWNLDGTSAISPTPLGDVGGTPPGLDPFDPKVVYDPYLDTFVLVFLGISDPLRRSSIVVVAMPDATATDPGTWCTTVLDGDAVPGDTATWADYPAVGYSEDRVTIATNQFTFPSTNARFRGAQIVSLPKTDLYDCASPLVGDVFSGAQTEEPNGAPAFTVQPAQTVGATAPDQFLLSFVLDGRDSSVTIWRLREGTNGLTLKKASLVVGRTKAPPPGTQAGGSLTDDETWWDTGDERLINAFYDADAKRLYAAHAVRRNAGPDTVTGSYPESAIRWYEVAPASRLGRSTMPREGTFATAETDAGWPSIATDEAGNVFITYSRASQPLGEYLSAWVAEIPPGSTTATTVILAPGVATYEAISGPERWGDYTAIGRDPVDGAYVATFNQYAAASSSFQQRVDVVTHG